MGRVQLDPHSSLSLIMRTVTLLAALCLTVSAEFNGPFNAHHFDLGSRIVFDTCPPYNCKGRDCETVYEQNGCPVCACPVGSPARGCDAIPVVLREELMNEGCPNVTDAHAPRHLPQLVLRWYRKIDKSAGVDACTGYMYPFCYDIDYNLWNSPKSKPDCEYYCYPEKDGTTEQRWLHNENGPRPQEIEFLIPGQRII